MCVVGLCVGCLLRVGWFFLFDLYGWCVLCVFECCGLYVECGYVYCCIEYVDVGLVGVCVYYCCCNCVEFVVG